MAQLPRIQPPTMSALARSFAEPPPSIVTDRLDLGPGAVDVGAPLYFDRIPITETAAFPPSDPCTSCWVYVTLNAEIALGLEHNSGLRDLLDSPRLRVSVDGQWLWWALRRKYPGRVLRKLSGSDLIHDLAQHCAARGERMFLLGSTPWRNALAIARLRSAYPGLEVDGLAPPHFDARRADEERDAHALICDRLRHARPDFVVLGLGADKEHRFAALHAAALDGCVRGLLCFGGAIDMASGQVRRAPRLWQRCGLEGIYRVLQQPQRLGRMIKVTRLLPRLASGRY